jgi:hypothetical protein
MIMAEIRTYALPATDTKSSRIRARYGNSTITREWPWESNHPHEDIAREMAERLYGPGATVEYVGEHARGNRYVGREANG